MIGRRFVVVVLLAVVVGCAGRASGGSDSDGMAEDEAPACEAEACAAGGPCCEVVDCESCPAAAACIVAIPQDVASFYCLEIPATCGGAPTCACLGDLVCETTLVCEEGDFEGSDLACLCPACVGSVDGPAERR
jgi:hypothetical protein